MRRCLHAVMPGVLAWCVLGLGPSAGSGAELAREEVFARAARSEGQAYALARDLLEREGQAILPFLKEKRKSAAWRERDLARALILRVERPKEVAVWLHALSSDWGHPFEPRPDGTVLVRFDPKEAENMERTGKPRPPTGQVVIDREAVPIFLDCLWEAAGERGWSRYEAAWPRATIALKHFADPDSAPALIHLYGPYREHEGGLLDALVAIGDPARPALRQAIREFDARRLASGGNEAIQRMWDDIRRAAGAARTLGRIGDRDSVALLTEKLKEATLGDLVEALSEALGAMPAPESVPVVFGHLVRTAEIQQKARGGHSSRDPEYPKVRQAMLAFGPVALPIVRERAAKAPALTARVVASGLLFELEHGDEAATFYRAWGEAFAAEERARWGTHPEDRQAADPLRKARELFWKASGRTGSPVLDAMPIPPALLAERACAFIGLGDLERCLQLPDRALALDILADALRVLEWDSRDCPRLVLLLAETGDERALGVYGAVLAKASYHCVESLAEGTLVLGNPRATSLLEEIIRRASETESSYERPFYERAAELAKAILPVLKGDAEHLVTLLASDKPVVALAAARHLARRGDVRALPVLLKAALAVEGDKSEACRELCAAIVGLGKPAVRPLEARRRAAPDWREKLLCEALALRIARPDLAAKYEQASRVRHPGFDFRGGPSIGHYEQAGKRLAEAVGPEAVPLLEAAVAFEQSGIAIFALAQFKEERSIAVLAKALGQRHYIRRGGDIAAVALQAFGEKGIEAAKSVPPPQPEKPQYESRASRHRGAAEALAIAKEVKGVQNILEGLNAPVPKPHSNDYYQWSSRTGVYLTLAGQYHDKRIADAIIALLAKDTGIWQGAVAVLGDYDDPRVVPLCTRFLGKYDVAGGTDPTLMALAKRLRGGIAPHLVKTLRGAPEENVRAGAAAAIEQLIAWGGKYGKYWQEAFKDRDEQVKACAEAARLATTELLAALYDPSAKVQLRAAEAVASIAMGIDGPITDRTPIEPLARWVTSQGEPPWRAVQYLAKSGEPAAGKALLAAYRRSGRKADQGLLGGLAELGVAEAVPELSRALDDRVAAKDFQWGIPELEPLGQLGEAGLVKLLAVFRSDDALEARVQAAAVLAKRGCGKAFPDIQKLFEELAANGPWDPRVTTVPNTTRSLRYCGFTVTLAMSLASLDTQRAYPILVRAAAQASDQPTREGLARQVRTMEEGHPELRKVPIPLAPGRPEGADAEGEKLPELRFLTMCDLWQEAVLQAGDRDEIPGPVRKELLAAGPEALAAMVELCYPPSEPPSAQEVADAVAVLADEKKQSRAAALLAIRLYPQGFLDRAIAGQKGPARARAEAVRRWRARGAWFEDKRQRLLTAATWMLEAQWPIEPLRAFAIAHLDRLAKVEKVEHHWSARPLGPLLASIRYSSDPAERNLLVRFLATARPGAAQTAEPVMRQGLTGRYGWTMAPHWKQLPNHRE